MGLESGALDLVSHLSSTQVAELNKDDFNIEQGTMNLVQALYLNNEAAPFDNELVRQALCYAVDRQGILDMAFDGYGFLIGSNVFPAFTKYFDESLTDYYTLETPEAGKEKAKELLAEAGYPNGFDMVITVPSNYAPHCDTAEVIAEQLKEVGINATLKKVEWESWVSDTYAGRNFQATLKMRKETAETTSSTTTMRITTHSSRRPSRPTTTKSRPRSTKRWRRT